MCDYSSQWKNQLKKHMESAHPVAFEDNKQEEKVEETNSETYHYYSETDSEDNEKNCKNECSICQARFVDQKCMNEHIAKKHTFLSNNWNI